MPRKNYEAIFGRQPTNAQEKQKEPELKVEAPPPPPTCASCGQRCKDLGHVHSSFSCDQGHKFLLCSAVCQRSFEKRCSKVHDALHKSQQKINNSVGIPALRLLPSFDREKLLQLKEADRNGCFICPEEVKSCCPQSFPHCSFMLVPDQVASQAGNPRSNDEHVHAKKNAEEAKMPERNTAQTIFDDDMLVPLPTRKDDDVNSGMSMSKSKNVKQHGTKKKNVVDLKTFHIDPITLSPKPHRDKGVKMLTPEKVQDDKVKDEETSEQPPSPPQLTHEAPAVEKTDPEFPQEDAAHVLAEAHPKDGPNGQVEKAQVIQPSPQLQTLRRVLEPHPLPMGPEFGQSNEDDSVKGTAQLHTLRRVLNSPHQGVTPAVAVVAPKGQLQEPKAILQRHDPHGDLMQACAEGLASFALSLDGKGPNQDVTLAVAEEKSNGQFSFQKAIMHRHDPHRDQSQAGAEVLASIAVSHDQKGPEIKTQAASNVQLKEPHRHLSQAGAEILASIKMSPDQAVAKAASHVQLKESAPVQVTTKKAQMKKGPAQDASQAIAKAHPTMVVPAKQRAQAVNEVAPKAQLSKPKVVAAKVQQPRLNARGEDIYQLSPTKQLLKEPVDSWAKDSNATTRTKLKSDAAPWMGVASQAHQFKLNGDAAPWEPPVAHPVFMNFQDYDEPDIATSKASKLDNAVNDVSWGSGATSCGICQTKGPGSAVSTDTQSGSEEMSPRSSHSSEGTTSDHPQSNHSSEGATSPVVSDVQPKVAAAEETGTSPKKVKPWTQSSLGKLSPPLCWCALLGRCRNMNCKYQHPKESEWWAEPAAGSLHKMMEMVAGIVSYEGTTHQDLMTGIAKLCDDDTSHARFVDSTLKMFGLRSMTELIGFLPNIVRRQSGLWYPDWYGRHDEVQSVRKWAGLSYKEAPELPPASLEGEELHLVDSAPGVQRFVQASNELLSAGGVVGLDIEWGGVQPVSLVQVAMAPRGGTVRVFLVDICIALDICMRTAMKNLLLPTSPDVSVVVFSPDDDLRRLQQVMLPADVVVHIVNRRQPGLDGVQWIDLQQLARTSNLAGIDPFGGRPSLARVVKAALGCVLDKQQQCSAWDQRPLSPEQVQYAAIDAAVLLRLWRVLDPEAGIASHSSAWGEGFHKQSTGPSPGRKSAKTKTPKTKATKPPKSTRAPARSPAPPSPTMVETRSRVANHPAVDALRSSVSSILAEEHSPDSSSSVESELSSAETQTSQQSTAGDVSDSSEAISVVPLEYLCNRSWDLPDGPSFDACIKLEFGDRVVVTWTDGTKDGWAFGCINDDEGREGYFPQGCLVLPKKPPCTLTTGVKCRVLEPYRAPFDYLGYLHSESGDIVEVLHQGRGLAWIFARPLTLISRELSQEASQECGWIPEAVLQVCD